MQLRLGLESTKEATPGAAGAHMLRWVGRCPQGYGHRVMPGAPGVVSPGTRVFE